MKKLLVYLTIILFCFTIPASALTVAWDANTDSAIGYIISWKQQGTTEEFRVNLPGKEVTQYVIEDKFLKISTSANPVIYDVWAQAYNDQEISDNSEVVTMERESTFSPPVSVLPTVEYDPEKPTKMVINVTP
jgi:hypothetical protein